jgi:hypothetical protein
LPPSPNPYVASFIVINPGAVLRVEYGIFGTTLYWAVAIEVVRNIMNIIEIACFIG